MKLQVASTGIESYLHKQHLIEKFSKTLGFKFYAGLRIKAQNYYCMYQEKTCKSIASLL